MAQGKDMSKQDRAARAGWAAACAQRPAVKAGDPPLPPYLAPHLRIPWDDLPSAWQIAMTSFATALLAGQRPNAMTTCGFGDPTTWSAFEAAALAIK